MTIEEQEWHIELIKDFYVWERKNFHNPPKATRLIRLLTFLTEQGYLRMDE